MTSSTIHGPDVIHPEKASAVGSRNSLNRNARNEYKESKHVVDEEVDKILNHISSKLPPEVLNKLHISSSIKELLHSYFNQGLHNMTNRYLTTAEDEMAKKFRDFVDSSEQHGLNKYTAGEVPKLLNQIGGEGKFNTTEVEKSVVNIYGHLQGHVQRGQFELEQETNSLLRQKVDIGAFIRGENVHSIIKCVFKDSLAKPETVTDISLAINILDEDMFSPIYHYQQPAHVLLSHVISDTIFAYVDSYVEKKNLDMVDKGGEDFSAHDVFFEKVKSMENLFSAAKTGKSDKISHAIALKGLSNKYVSLVKGIPAEISKLYSDPLSVKENITKLLDADAVRNRGFNTAVNTITSILDTSRMGYQFVENNKNARQLIIREYEDEVKENLPDENYEINMQYLDANQLRETRIAYAQTFSDFEVKTRKVWGVCQEIYSESKKNFNRIDYDDVKNEYLGKEKKGLFAKLFSALGASDTEDDFDENGKIWDEILFIHPDDTEIEKANATFKDSFDRTTKLFELIREEMESIFKRIYPIERVYVEERVDALEESLNEFYKMYNPFHCQPGLNMQINVTTVKRKKTTMKSISNVLNEFFYGISREFQDQAFADFQRRRSTDTTGEYKDFVSYDVAPTSNEDTVSESA